jgi:cell division protein FtsW (lipid II flippase)
VNLLLPPSLTDKDRIESRLLTLAAIFLFLFCIALSLSSAVRLHSWDVAYRTGHWVGFAIWLVGFLLLHQQLCKLLPDRDPYILPIVALLSGWGLLTIYRLDSDFGIRQTLWLGLCMLLLWVAARIPGLLNLLRRYKYLWLLAGLLLTAMTLVMGFFRPSGSPQLWLGISGNYLQPSELLKLLLIIYLAAYFADRMPTRPTLLSLLAPTLILFAVALLILLAQRDLGTAVLFIIIYTAVIYLADGHRRILLFSGAFVLITSLVGYRLFDVIQLRVNSWINPWLDPSGKSYQIVQSLLAVAAGGVFGRGPGLGNPTLVPVAQSDFIASAIAEEMGMIGIIALLGLLALWICRGLSIALHAPNQYQRYLAGGLTVYLAAQAILIIAGNLRVLPLTGVTLPFISYGGSSLLTSFLAITVLLLISNNADDEPAQLVTSRPYQFIGGIAVLALVAIALADGYWGAVQSADMLTRQDNPRRGIADQFSKRGSLLDENNQELDVTNGKSGTYQRSYLYPPLSSTLGYNDSTYGEAGLEASLDGYLRGDQGYPASTIWWNHLVYGQPPAGLNVRLSLDLELQERADQLLAGHKGALVLLNASTGEILAMSSHPNFDPNQLASQWQELIAHPDSPLLNRATQVLYHPGTALAPFLLAESLQTSLPNLPEQTNLYFDGKDWLCPQFPTGTLEWGTVIADGCPGAAVSLASQFNATQYNDLLTQLGFYQAPQLPLQVAQPDQQQSFTSPVEEVFGATQIKVTPLQMALAAATLSNGGKLLSPQLALAVQTSSQGWVFFPTQQSTKTNIPHLSDAANMLASSDFPGWESLGISSNEQGNLTWYLGGTLPNWNGTPLAVALVLEENNPYLARTIGQSVLQAAENP